MFRVVVELHSLQCIKIQVEAEPLQTKTSGLQTVKFRAQQVSMHLFQQFCFR